MARLLTLKKRAEFQRVRGGSRVGTPGFLIEGKRRPRDDDTGPRFGFTITKKLGGAVVRNKMRRRLKAALAETSSRLADHRFDYVIVARPEAYDRPFRSLIEDFEMAFRRLHAPSSREKP